MDGKKPTAEELGRPKGLVGMMEKVWLHQETFLIWDGEVAEKALETGQATPQGDPWEPLMLGIWVASGALNLDTKEEERRWGAERSGRAERERSRSPRGRGTTSVKVRVATQIGEGRGRAR